MTNIEDNGDKFALYVCQELKGAIVSRGFSQARVARSIKRHPNNVSKWLEGKPPVPISVAMQICSVIGVDFVDIVKRAEQRMSENSMMIRSRVRS